MNIKRTNIHHRLLKERAKTEREVDILAQVRAVLEADNKQEERILKTLNHIGGEVHNELNFDLLETDRIFHEETIKKICIDYRLRFLDTHYFKGTIPQEGLSNIKQMERDHGLRLKGFKIIAPSKMFVLHKTDDPLLFVPMGNSYYFMVHKWGNDLHPLRKSMMWPFKCFENLIMTILLSSILATLLVPDGLFSKNPSFSQDLMVFFFMFKSIGAVVIYYGFAQGKNFSTAIWQSRFDKAQ